MSTAAGERRQVLFGPSATGQADAHPCVVRLRGVALQTCHASRGRAGRFPAAGVPVTVKDQRAIPAVDRARPSGSTRRALGWREVGAVTATGAAVRPATGRQRAGKRASTTLTIVVSGL